jgi:ComF family protein
MWMLDFLAPSSCVFCGLSSKGDEKSICVACYGDLPWNEPAVSPTPGIFDRSIAMLHYEFPVDAAIKALKFNRKLYYAPALGEVLCAACPMLPKDIDAVLPVPLHWRRKTFRGFNQAMEIAKPVAKMLGVPMLTGVQRKRATPFQSGLDAAERSRNLQRAFRAPEIIRHAHVLIIDDVVTTGATTIQLAKALRRSGADKTSVLAVAKAY